MKRNGFTIAELVITMGIIGIIAAIMGAVIMHTTPDYTKTLYLKRYDSVSKSIKELSSNSRLFPACQDNINCVQHPLFNTMQGIDGRYVAIGSGDEKLCLGLAFALNGQSAPNLNCSNQPLEYSDGSWNPSFTTFRTEWLVSTQRNIDNNNATYQTDIYFDLNGADGPNCIYSENCPKPDRFKLMVAANGIVVAADPIGQEYIKTRRDWKKRKLNIKDNSTVLTNLNDNLKNFTIEPCNSENDNAENNENPIPENPESPINPNNGIKQDFNFRIACGDTFRDVKINCFNAEQIYYDILSSGVQYAEYPILFNPSRFVFQEPVSSNITFTHYTPHNILFTNTSKSYSMLKRGCNQALNVYASTSISSGNKYGSSTSEFFPCNEDVPLTYPTAEEVSQILANYNTTSITSYGTKTYTMTSVYYTPHFDVNYIYVPSDYKYEDITSASGRMALSIAYEMTYGKYPDSVTPAQSSGYFIPDMEKLQIEWTNHWLNKDYNALEKKHILDSINAGYDVYISMDRVQQCPHTTGAQACISAKKLNITP